MTADLTFAEVRRAVIVTLERAADTLRRLPMPRNGRPALERSSWPMMPIDPDDASGQASSRSPRLPPGPRAISELDNVLPWLRELDNTDRQLVWARAVGLSWSRLAREFGINVGRLRDLEQGRTKADSALLAYMAVIEREPEAVERALG